MLWRGTIYGELASKSNSPQLFVLRGRPKITPSKKAQQYRKNAIRQIAFKIGRPTTPISCEVILYADIYYASESPDLDENLLMDVLQVKDGASVIKNDRQIRGKRTNHHIDRENPRAEVRLVER